MASFLPTPKDTAHLRYSITLSGATYTITWLWNERDRAWYFSMDDPSGEPLIASVRVVLNTDLLNAAPAGDRRPPYRLVVVDMTGSAAEPTYETISTSVRIAYLEPEDA